MLSRDREDGRATWQPQGVGSEAYLNGTSQGPTPCGCQEGRPYQWSQQVIHEMSGLTQLRDNMANKLEVLCRDISEANPHADRYGIGIGTEGNIYPHYLCPYP